MTGEELEGTDLYGMIYMYMYKGKLFHRLKLGQMASQIRVVDVGQFICEGLSHSSGMVGWIVCSPTLAIHQPRWRV